MKALYYLITAALFFTTGNVKAQPNWAWTHGLGGSSEERGYSIVVDASGNVYTTGRFSGTVDFDPGPGIFNLSSSGSYDLFISKLNSSGNFSWAKSFVGPGICEGLSIAISPASNGDIYTTGRFTGTVDFDPGPLVSVLTSPGSSISIFVSRLDSSGNFVWAKSMSGTDDIIGQSISVDALGNVYTAGDFWSTVDFDPGPGIFNITAVPTGALPDGFISKLDSTGSFVWAKAFSGTSDNMIQAIATDHSGNVYSTGYYSGTVDFDPGPGIYNMTSSFGGGSYDAFISRMDSSGALKWIKTARGGMDDFGFSITVDPVGEMIYATGNFSDTIDFDPGPGVYNLGTASNITYESFIWKLDSTGNFVWARGMQGRGITNGSCIAVNPIDGDVYISGVFVDTVDFDPGPGVFNLSAITASLFIADLDSSGNFAWVKSAAGTGLNFGRAVAFDPSGNCYLTGDFKGPSISFDTVTIVNADVSGNTYDFFIAKLDTSIITAIIPMGNVSRDISIFPNPAIDYVIVLYPGNSKEAILNITDITGKIIYTATISSRSLEVNTSDFDAGMYFWEIREPGIRKSGKLIISK